jgi:hypothetical protein
MERSARGASIGKSAAADPPGGAGRRSPRLGLLRSLGLGSFLTALALPLPALACPDCALGREARRSVWSDDFAHHLAVALLPFVVIGAICAHVEARGRRPWTERNPTRRQGPLSPEERGA